MLENMLASFVIHIAQGFYKSKGGCLLRTMLAEGLLPGKKHLKEKWNLKYKICPVLFFFPQFFADIFIKNQLKLSMLLVRIKFPPHRECDKSVIANYWNLRWPKCTTALVLEFTRI